MAPSPSVLGYGLAALLSGVLACAELWTAHYSRTGFLLWRCRPFYFYGLLYIAIGFVLMGLWQQLTATGVVRIEGLGINSPVVQGVVIGISSRAFMNISLFNVTSGQVSYPIGIKTLIQMIEPSILRAIELEHFSALRDFIGPFAQPKGVPRDLNDVRHRIKSNIPPKLPQPESLAFQADIDAADSVERAMELWLTFAGRRNFLRVFAT